MTGNSVVINYIYKACHGGEGERGTCTSPPTASVCVMAVHINDLCNHPLLLDLKVTHRVLFSSALSCAQCGLPAEIYFIAKWHNNFLEYLYCFQSNSPY